MTRRAIGRLTGFTLTEILFAVLIVAFLAALALVGFQRAAQKARAVEAVGNLRQIKEAQRQYRVQHGEYVEALEALKQDTTLDVALTSRNFDYALTPLGPEAFRIVATSKPGLGEPLQVAMDQEGRFSYTWPDSGTGVSAPPAHRPGAQAPPGGGSTIGFGGSAGGGSGISEGGGGGGGGAGSSGSSGSSGGSSSGSGGGDSSGGDSGGSSGGTDSGGGGGDGGSGDGGGGGGGDDGGGGGARPFTYIARGADDWTDWPEVNTTNIFGSIGTTLLSDAFDVVAQSGASSITDDFTRRGLDFGFVDADMFAHYCQDAIACFLYSLNYDPPQTPGELPIMIFNPAYLDEPAGILATVLVHEGTHFQEYLDGRSFNAALGTVDIEFDSFWNEAVYWGEVRSQFGPPFNDSFLENQAEVVYQLAQQGEGSLRNAIANAYCDGLSDC